MFKESFSGNKKIFRIFLKYILFFIIILNKGIILICSFILYFLAQALREFFKLIKLFIEIKWLNYLFFYKRKNKLIISLLFIMKFLIDEEKLMYISYYFFLIIFLFKSNIKKYFLILIREKSIIIQRFILFCI